MPSLGTYHRSDRILNRRIGARNRWGFQPWKVFDFPLENSGMDIDTVLAVIQLSARLCEYSCTRHGPHYAPEGADGPRGQATPPSCMSVLHRHPRAKSPAFPHTLHRKLSTISGDCTCLGNTFGRDRPLRRQLQLRYRPCPARRSLALACSNGPENGRSSIRPTGQP